MTEPHAASCGQGTQAVTGKSGRFSGKSIGSVGSVEGEGEGIADGVSVEGRGFSEEATVAGVSVGALVGSAETGETGAGERDATETGEAVVIEGNVGAGEPCGGESAVPVPFRNTMAKMEKTSENVMARMPA